MFVESRGVNLGNFGVGVVFMCGHSSMWLSELRAGVLLLPLAGFHTTSHHGVFLTPPLFKSLDLAAPAYPFQPHQDVDNTCMDEDGGGVVDDFGFCTFVDVLMCYFRIGLRWDVLGCYCGGGGVVFLLDTSFQCRFWVDIEGARGLY